MTKEVDIGEFIETLTDRLLEKLSEKKLVDKEVVDTVKELKETVERLEKEMQELRNEVEYLKQRVEAISKC